MGENCPRLLDLMMKERAKVGNNKEGEEKKSGCDESKKLELRLGLPGDEGWSNQNNNLLKNNSVIRQGTDSQHHLSLSYFSPSKLNQGQKHINNPHNPWACSGYQTQPPSQQQISASPFAQYKTGPVMPKESQPCCTQVMDMQNAEKKAFPPASANTAVPNTSQKRAAPASVVGWPPVRSFRKNLGSTSAARPSGLSDVAVIPGKPDNAKSTTDQTLKKGGFVKINMDGVPIGRKVDLSAFDSYDKLAAAVDKLFRGLLAAQRDSSVSVSENKQEEQKPITGLLDGSGEYTLVYEDNEGDRILVGDVPWRMFVSTVKRLRVLKSSDLPALNCSVSDKGKTPGEEGSPK